MKNRNKHIILTGFSNSGKNFVGELILQQQPNIVRCITAATRAPRPNERNGVDYFFFDKPEFIKKEQSGWFIETNSYLKELGLPDFLYGTPKDFVEQCRYEYQMLFNVDPNGAEKLEEYFKGEAISVFLDVEDIAVLIERAKERRSNESDEEVKARQDLVAIQAKKKNTFDYCLVNKNGEDNAKKLAETILTLSSI